MAKVTAPLMGLGASKSLGKAITYQGSKKGTMVRKMIDQTYRNSAAQQSQRSLYKTACDNWTGASQEVKDDFNDAVKGKPMTGFNLYVQNYINRILHPAIHDRWFYGNDGDTYNRSTKVNDNYGGSGGIVMRCGPVQQRRGFFYWDLAARGFHPGKEILSATMYLWAYYIYGWPAYGHDFYLTFQSKEPFCEYEITWNRWRSTNVWTTPGGDWLGDPPGQITQHLTDTEDEWKEFDVTELVKYAQYSNDQKLLIILRFANEGQGSNDYISFISNNSGNEPLRPKLKITYKD